MEATNGLGNFFRQFLHNCVDCVKPERRWSLVPAGQRAAAAGGCRLWGTETRFLKETGFLENPAGSRQKQSPMVTYTGFPGRLASRSGRAGNAGEPTS
jgi:hypothetical protein